MAFGLALPLALATRALAAPPATLGDAPATPPPLPPGSTAPPRVLVAPEKLAPLDIEMRGYEYPFPVKFFPIKDAPAGTRMAYMDVKPMLGDTGPAAILMHGRNFPSSYWERVATALSARGYRVIIPDQVGFGKSTKAEMPYSFAFWAENTAALAAQLKVKSAVVIGHSIGGIMATTLAAAHPELVSRLVLEDPLGLEDYRTLVPEVTDDFLFDRETKLTPDAYREFLKTSYFPNFKPEYEAYVTIRARQMLDKKYPQWVRSYIQSYQLLHKTPIAATLASLPMPVTMIVGEKDNNAPGKAYAPEAVRAQLGKNADLAVALAPKLKKGAAITLAGLGHVPHLDDIAAFDTALEKALA